MVAKAKHLAFLKEAYPYTSASISKHFIQTETVLKFLQLLFFKWQLFFNLNKNSIKFELWTSSPHLTIHHYLLSKMIFPALILLLMFFGRYYINLTSTLLTTDYVSAK